jgi:pimeloyl-[acyl-carrier protein] methyl ester esterase
VKHLVLLHGWAGHSQLWGDFAAQLPPHYRVTLVDLPWRDNLEAISDEIVAALDGESFYLLGWSLGGTVALDIAARYANRVQGVILMATNPCFVATETWAGMPVETFDAFAEQLHANPVMTLQRFLALQLQSSPAFLKDAKARFSLKPAPELVDLETSLALLKTSDLRTFLADLNCPIAVILSDNDALIPVEVGQQMQTLQPNLHLTVLRNATHIPFVTQPKDCLNAIHTFLDGIR